MIIVVLFLLLSACTYTNCNVYTIPHNNYTISVHVCDEHTIQSKFDEYINNGYRNLTNKQGKIVGFCIPSKHEVWSIPDYEIILHEFWHVLGNLEEPYWDK